LKGHVEQAALFGPIYPYGAGVQPSDTSIAAGEAVTPTLRERQINVLQALLRHGSEGATADELCADLGLTRNSVAPRLTEMSKLGTVIDSGRRRRTPAGGLAAVYVVGTRR